MKQMGMQSFETHTPQKSRYTLYQYTTAIKLYKNPKMIQREACAKTEENALQLALLDCKVF